MNETTPRILLGWVGSALAAALLPAEPAADAWYQGRAFGASSNLPAARGAPLCDTGELPAAGGAISSSLPGGWSDPFVRARVMVSLARGAGPRAESFATLSSVTVLPGHPAEVHADMVRAQCEVGCSRARGSVVIVGLAFGGVPIPVTGEAGQMVVLPGIGRLVINEQQVTSDRKAIIVNAVHLFLPDGEEVILSSARCGLDCATAVPGTSWGRLKALYR